jgi:hypothetical protein
MARKRFAPLTTTELRYLLKKDPKLRKALRRLRLKLTTSGRLVGLKREYCVPPDFKPGKDPLIFKRGVSKRRK